MSNKMISNLTLIVNLKVTVFFMCIRFNAGSSNRPTTTMTPKKLRHTYSQVLALQNMSNRICTANNSPKKGQYI